MWLFDVAGEGGEGEPPPEGLGDEGTHSEDEEEESVASSASRAATPQSNNPLEPETELILRWEHFIFYPTHHIPPTLPPNIWCYLHLILSTELSTLIFFTCNPSFHCPDFL